MATPQVLPQDETIALLLERSQRPKPKVPLRRTFVQKLTPAGKPKAGPLASLVRDPRSLELFLIAHAVASGGDYSVTEWATTWARTIGLYDTTSGPTAVSRAWKRLEDTGLIIRNRGDKGKARITLLREDGSGKRYSHPYAHHEAYFTLPYEYWKGSERYHVTLGMPAKVMLLITLSLRKDEFTLPQEKVPDWYEISADTAGRGLGELRNKGLLEVVREELFATLQSKTGYTARHVYRLMPPFDLKSRGMGVKRRRRTTR